jgi:hypothetical protein
VEKQSRKGENRQRRYGTIMKIQDKSHLILFIDIDGVLNSFESKTSYHYKDNYNNGNNLDKECLKQLFRIIKETGCQVIISSNWRRHTHNNKCRFMSNDSIYYSPLPRLLTIIERKLGYTPELLPQYSGDRTKGNDIRSFMKENNLSKYDCLAIDDCVDDEDFRGFKYLETSIKTGLTEEIADKAIDFFKGE